MTHLGQRLRQTARRLANAGIGDSTIEAELVWMTALDVDRVELYARLNESPDDVSATRAEDLVARRLRHEPAAYLMGHREFYGLDFVVAPGVLIPRPDTETLVEEALRLLKAASKPSPTIVDVGCGSGAIGIALATHTPHATVYAIDIAPRAIEITRLNATRHDVSGRVHVLRGDLLAPLAARADLIAANLPYVMTNEIPTLEPEIHLFEPREALDGGADGLGLIKRLLAQAPSRLTPGGAVLLEMDPRQIAAAREVAAQHFPGASIYAVRDLASRERVLAAVTAAQA